MSRRESERSKDEMIKVKVNGGSMLNAQRTKKTLLCLCAPAPDGNGGRRCAPRAVGCGLERALIYTEDELLGPTRCQVRSYALLKLASGCPHPRPSGHGNSTHQRTSARAPLCLAIHSHSQPSAHSQAGHLAHGVAS
eukprot:scaffold23382_cov36-Tisochrysis_lutea.AAC.1